MYTYAMDELDIGGKKYISSRRAGEITGYAKDYIGQLARAEKIIGTRVGRAWYVDEQSLRRHAGMALRDTEGPVEVREHSSDSELASSSLNTISNVLPIALNTLRHASSDIPKTWSPVSYSEDRRDLIPSNPVVSSNGEKITSQTKDISDNQDYILKVRVVESKKLSSNKEDSIPPRTIDIPVPSRVFRVARPQSPISLSGRITAPIRISRLPSSISPVIPLKKQPNVRRLPPIAAIHASHNSAMPFLALAFAVAVFGVLSSGFFVASEVTFTGGEQNTASVFFSYQYLKDFIASSSLLESGVATIQWFFTILISSFETFLTKGIDFILYLIHFF